ncbi:MULTISPECIES: hypothetical protein [Pseudomonas]|uniref:hypothetical protein n=1 Tax=Pseudomonas TaxID=286 RepID=UPI0006806794|nr:hypothetical protein [Pseudomonas lini]KNH43710.1 hypothetical protein ACS73_24745 [Pseudomonas lini]
MSNKQITVPSEYAESVLGLIEHRIREIGKTYQGAKSNLDDEEITAFRAMARQLGYDFEVLSEGDGFAITRYEFKPVE